MNGNKCWISVDEWSLATTVDWLFPILQKRVLIKIPVANGNWVWCFWPDTICKILPADLNLHFSNVGQELYDMLPRRLIGRSEHRSWSTEHVSREFQHSIYIYKYIYTLVVTVEDRFSSISAQAFLSVSLGIRLPEKINDSDFGGDLLRRVWIWGPQLSTIRDIV